MYQKGTKLRAYWTDLQGTERVLRIKNGKLFYSFQFEESNRRFVGNWTVPNDLYDVY